MKVYIGSSGDLNGKDQGFLIAVCVPTEAQAHLPVLFHKLRDRLGRSNPSQPQQVSLISAKELLDEEVFSKAQSNNKQALAAVEVVEEIFQQLSFSPYFNPITIFGVIMPRLNFEPYFRPGILPSPILYLLQRVNNFIKNRGLKQTAAVYFDQDFQIYSEDALSLRNRFTMTVTGTAEGVQEKWEYIASTASFTKPVFEDGLQLADIIATCLQLGWQKKLVPFYVRPTWDRPSDGPALAAVKDSLFLSSLACYLKVIFSHTVNLEPYYGIYAMSVKDFQHKPPESEPS